MDIARKAPHAPERAIVKLNYKVHCVLILRLPQRSVSNASAFARKSTTAEAS